MAKLQILYTTLPNKRVAEKIAAQLVSENLAACVNILPVLSSTYKWKGKLVKDKEVVLLAKTLAKKMPQLLKKLETLHPYECPCVIVTKSVKVNAKYLEWVGAQL